ncbi:MAG: hypothetical protein KY394_02310 [Actinobacteria bacterium]|nr:hypothetical protein [Actinomycetota bacterium]
MQTPRDRTRRDPTHSDEIAGAEIHLAVARRGQLDPMLLPAQITTPAGTPTHWWIALFKIALFK